MYAQDVGAYLVGMDFIQIHPSLGAPKPGRFSTDARYYCMVNTEGKRFVREDGRRDVQVDAIFKQPGKYFWMIWDDWGRKDLRVKDDVIEKNVKAGNIFRGKTIRELAEQIRVPGENLENTIARYNKLVEQGKDDDFGKDTYNLPYKLAVPPFYAHMNKPAIHHCMGGILTDVKSQVIGRDYQPIPRLYAGGEVTGGIQGANRLGGNATPDCLFYGRVAGKNAAVLKPWDGKKA
jgi:succinate dehydrogenase/fumarate reductase flavoprotein subunit